ncbi:MAG: hypothetical protein FWB90_00620 [Fibromonadales bacterium]|nr:hypothetical protein [Fibromonadales bacterium]
MKQVWKKRPGTTAYTGLEKPTEKQFKQALIGLYNPEIRYDYFYGYILLRSDVFSKGGKWIEHKLWWLHSGMRDTKNYTRIPRMEKLCTKYRKWIGEMREEKIVIGEAPKQRRLKCVR